MKKILRLFLIFFCAIAFFQACTKDKLEINKSEKYLDANTSTSVRFIHAFSSNSINTVTPITATTAPPALNFFVNGERLNAFTSTTGNNPGTFTTPYSGAFPGNNLSPFGAIVGAGATNGNLNFDYANFSAGNVRIAAALFRTTTTPAPSPADTVMAGNFVFESGKKYTLIAGDTVPNQRFYSFEDNFNEPDTNNYAIRIINMAPIVATPSYTGFDVFSRRRQTNIATNLSFRNASNFTELSVVSPVQPWLPTIINNDTLEVRPTGAALTTAPLASFFGFLPVRKRVYTFVIRGVTNLASPRNVQISGYLNR